MHVAIPNIYYSKQFSARVNHYGLQEIFFTMKLAPIIIISLLLTACGIGKYNEPRYYDFPSPDQLPALTIPVQIKSFGNSTAVKQRMIYRTADDELLIDEYSRFVQPPEKMLERYLATAFASRDFGGGKSDKTIICVYGKIFLIEFDASSLEARLGVEYTIEEQSADGVVSTLAFDSAIYRSQATSAAPEVMTRALSRCVAQFADQIHHVIEQEILNQQ